MFSAVGSDDASHLFGQAFNFECFVTFITGRRLVHLAASRRRAAPTVEPVGEHVYKTLFSYSIRSSHNPVRRLPFETDTVRNMQIFTYLWPYLFRIVHVIWTAR